MFTSRQFAAAVALLIVLCHVVVLWSLGSSSQGVLWSNVLQLVSSLAAAGAYAYAARRSADFVRRFCWLVSSSFFLWSIAQSGWLYYEYALRAVVPSVSPINVLFFFFVAPLGLAIFLPVGEQRPQSSITFFLDFIQLAAVLVTVYLYFFYTPTFWLGRQGELNQALRRASEWRNWVLTAGLAARALLASRGVVRRLFARVAVVMAIYSVGESLYFNLTQSSLINTGKWYDLTWSASFALAIVFAFQTETATAAGANGRSEAYRANLAFHLMPALIPVLVLITAARMVRDQLVIAASAVLFSFGCYSLRLFILQMQAQRAATARQRSEEFFKKLATASSETGERLFEALVSHAAEILKTRYAYAAVFEDSVPDRMVRTLAATKNGQLIPAFEYKLRVAPCQNVLERQFYFHPHGVAVDFPLHHLLFEMSSYMGAPLVSSTGEVLGVFAVVGDRPLRNAELAKSVLQICAARASTEFERMQVEEARRTSEEIFSLAFHQSSDIMMLMKPLPREERARLMDINEAGLTFWGGTREEIIGKTGAEVEKATGVEFWRYEADRALFYKDLLEHGKIATRELSVRKRSGEIRKLLLSATVFHVKNTPWIFSSSRDITDEKAAQDALAASEAKYRDLFENANDVMFTTAPSGKFLSINKAGRKLFGLSPEGVLGSIQHFLDEPSVEVYERCLRDLLKDKLTRTCEVASRPDGQGKRLLDLSLRPVIEDGMIRAIQGTGRDITQRRELEGKLLQSQKMEVVGRLAGGIAHDFNNLLTVIAGYAYMAREHAAKNSDAMADLEEIREAVQRASALTSQMLAFSRKQTANLVPMNLNDSVSGMEKMLRRVIGEDIKLELKLDPGLAPVLADAGQIDQVVMNLAVNARDAMPNGGELRFVTSNLWLQTANRRLALDPGEYAVLTVKDSGVGMSPETLKHIFEPFFTTKEVGKGTGLGLSTVYGIVHQCRGQIEVASEPGRGTTFSLYFPTVQRSALQPSQLKAEVLSQGNETLLLVEDDAALRSLAQRALESAGYKVYAASGVEQATRVLQEISRRIDLMITDVVMAEGGGVEFVARLHDSRPETKVLFISGYTDGRLPEEYLGASWAGFLAKPFEPAQLTARIRQLLDSRRAPVAAVAEQ